MDKCWKCGNLLRQPNPVFCHACGSAQKPDEPNTPAASPWQARLRATEHTSAAWRLLWILTGPLAILLFPLHLRSATLRLRRHIKQRLESPAFATPRFQTADEGRQIARRLLSCGGGPMALPSLGAFALALILVGVLFLAPLSAKHLEYGDAMDGLLGGSIYHSDYVNSEAQYDQAWRRLSPMGDVGVYTFEESNSGSFSSKTDYNTKTATLPHWDETHSETLFNHRPYEYISNKYYDRDQPHKFRVSTVFVHSHFSTPLTIAFWTGVGILYLSFLVLGVQFWRRFASHVTAEAFAAAYARADTTLLDKLLPGIKARNGGMIILGILFALFPLQLLLFPFFSYFTFVNHEKWERTSGVTEALGA